MEPLAVLAAVLAQCCAALALDDADMTTAASEGRTGHRAGMIFPLLLAISRRLAALIPTALMSLVAIAAMLVFAKKAFLMSAAALAVALYDSYRTRKKQKMNHGYQEVVEPIEFTEVHFKPAPPSYSSKYSKMSPFGYPYKRPSSYDVPLHSGASSYYRRQPVAGYASQTLDSYSKPQDAYSSPSQSLDASSGGDAAGDSYEVVDDYRPLGGGPAYVGDASETQETFSPYYQQHPNHQHHNHQQQHQQQQQLQESASQEHAQSTPAASLLSPVGAGPNHRPQAQAQRAQQLLQQQQQQHQRFRPYNNHRIGGHGRTGRAGGAKGQPTEAAAVAVTPDAAHQDRPDSTTVTATATSTAA